MLTLKLAEALEARVLEVLSKRGIETPTDINGYPDLRIFSLKDIESSGFTIRIFGEVKHDGERFFVGPKIDQ